jgi:hypothetical protein
MGLNVTSDCLISKQFFFLDCYEFSSFRRILKIKESVFFSGKIPAPSFFYSFFDGKVKDIRTDESLPESFKMFLNSKAVFLMNSACWGLRKIHLRTLEAKVAHAVVL